MNRHNRKYLICGIALALLLPLAGCKPTENNYRKAYEAARSKKKAEETDPDIDISNMIREGVPRRTVVEGDSAYVRYEPLSVYGDLKPASLMAYNVAVGCYKMRSNALSDAENLRAAGYESFLLRNGKEEYYVITGTYTTLPDAVSAMREFMRKHKERPYVGLPEEPVIEVPSGMVPRTGI